MSDLLINYKRRVEKIIQGLTTIPAFGTNHIDDTWLDTDVYPGELSIDFSRGALTTSNGFGSIALNTENVFVNGLVLSKPTSGVNKIQVSSGIARINGKIYTYTSSTTDWLFDTNHTLNDKLYFVWAKATDTITDASLGYYQLALDVSVVEDTFGNPEGLYDSIASYSTVPNQPTNSILLGCVIVPPGSAGFLIFPKSVANTGDYYPKFSLTPSEFLRKSTKEVNAYTPYTLFFYSSFIQDVTSRTIYVAVKTFVSGANIADDVTAGNLIEYVGTGSGGGGNTSIGLGTGTQVYSGTVGSQFQFRSIKNNGPITVSLVDSNNSLEIGFDSTGFLKGATSSGAGQSIIGSTTGNTVTFLSVQGATGSGISVSSSGGTLFIDNSNVQRTITNIGPSPSFGLYAGVFSTQDRFKSLVPGPGIGITSDSNSVTISSDVIQATGANIGSGASIYAGITSGSILNFKTITSSDNSVIITQNANEINLVAGQSKGATSIGTGYPIYAGELSNVFQIKSITAGDNIIINDTGDTIIISSTVTTGASGPQGLEGIAGPQGYDGPQGPSIVGPQGVQGVQGIVGFQGAQGIIGAQGPTSPISNQRFIEMYDNTGGWTLIPGNTRRLPLDFTRNNTDGVLFTSGALTETLSPNGTYIQIAEAGYYQIDYRISALLDANTFAIGRVRNTTTNINIDASDIILRNNTSTVQTVTSTASFTVNLIANERYCLVVENQISSVGNVTGVVDATSIVIKKLEVGYGSDGSQGAVGPQGIPGPITIDAGKINMFSSIEAVGSTTSPKFFRFAVNGPTIFSESFGSSNTYAGSATRFVTGATLTDFAITCTETDPGVDPGTDIEIIVYKNNTATAITFDVPDTVVVGTVYTAAGTLSLSAGDSIAIRTVNNTVGQSIKFILSCSQIVSVGPAGPQGVEGPSGGPQGGIGPQGIAGIDGIAGVQGAQGPAGGGGSTGFQGNRLITRGPYQGLNVGGTTLEQFINNFFFPFVPSVLSINSGTTYVEVGTITSTTINGTWTANDETIKSGGYVNKNGVSWNTFGSTTPFSYPDTGLTLNAPGNFSYQAFLSVGNNGTPTTLSSGTRAISFIYPFFYGMSTSNLSTGGTALYTGLTKQISPSSNFSTNLVGVGTYIYFAYPQSYGALSSIVDPNNFNITADFDVYNNVSVISTGLSTNYSTNYRIYKLRVLASPNGLFKFNF